MSRQQGERRLSTPLVLAAASTMVSVGIVAWISSQPSEDPPTEPAGPPEVLVDTSTPALAAESFLDAWRKRAHEVALELSMGNAQQRVTLRKEEDDRMSPEEREVKERIWDTMASGRLELQIEQSDELGPGRVALQTLAVGEFLGKPYRRQIEFVMREEGDTWRVEQMALGEIVSDTPDFLELDPSVGRDPSEFEIRGEDVP